MGASAHSPRAGILSALVLMAAIALSPADASAGPRLIDETVKAETEIGATASSDVMDAGMARLPSSIGRTNLDSEVLCLARAVYWEAKSEPRIGKIAVAAVTLNRVEDRRFPHTICEVVTQRGGGRCQFTWACDGRRNVTPSGLLWSESLAVAREALHVGVDDPTDGALFFHGTRERTDWRGVRRYIARIGNHIFYR